MKRIIIVTLLTFIAQISNAKIVKFSVDMTGQTISPNGVHVMGDFQEIAGLGQNFTPDGALMQQDAQNPNIYFLNVNIPAFHKYEYKFVNGDLGYEVEIVPEEAQVGYDFDDYRWIYVDSLANDTMSLPAIKFGKTSADGYVMMRLLVDMTLQTPSPNGVHLAGDFQGWSPSSTRLYSFGDNTYEIIMYGTAGTTYEYRYINGNTNPDLETVPAACATNSNRSIVLNGDTVLPKICYNLCSTCFPSDIKNIDTKSVVSIYPNPTNDYATIVFEKENSTHQIVVRDVLGQIIFSKNLTTENSYTLNCQTIPQGIYMVEITNSLGGKTVQKLQVK